MKHFGRVMLMAPLILAACSSDDPSRLGRGDDELTRPGGTPPPGLDKLKIETTREIDAGFARCRIMRVAARRLPYLKQAWAEVGATDTEIAQLESNANLTATQWCSSAASWWTRSGFVAYNAIVDSIAARLATRLDVTPIDAKEAIALHVWEFAQKFKGACVTTADRLAFVDSETTFNDSLDSIALGSCRDRKLTPINPPARRDAEQKAIEDCMDEFTARLRPSCDPRADKGGGGDDKGDKPVVTTTVATDDKGNKTTTTTYVWKDGTKVTDVSTKNGSGAETSHTSTVTDPKGNSSTVTIKDSDPVGTDTATTVSIGLWVAAAAFGGVAAFAPDPRAKAVGGAGAFVFGTLAYVAGKQTPPSGPKKYCIAFDAAGTVTYDPVVESGIGKPDALTAFNYCRCKAQEDLPPPSPTECGDCISLPSRCLSADDKAKMECLKNPFGPDDGVRKECVKYLQDDTFDWTDEQIKKICLAARCVGATTPILTGANLSCPCLAPTDGPFKFKGPLRIPKSGTGCDVILCPEGSICTCDSTGSQCGCIQPFPDPPPCPNPPCTGPGDPPPSNIPPPNG